jgi:predicted acetyltransferase
MGTHVVQLIVPGLPELASYRAALETGWSSDNTREAQAALEELARMDADAVAFVSGLIDPEANGPPVTLQDGSRVPRLPSITKWMWDGDVCGSICLRWVPGTPDLPPTCLGHVGYGVVPWKRGRGYATQALADILPDAKAVGLPYIEVTTSLDNVASQKVITRNGGRFVERFTKAPHFASEEGLRYRIDL